MNLIGPFPGTTAPVRPGVYQVVCANGAWFARFEPGQPWFYCDDRPDRAAAHTRPSAVLARYPFEWYGVAR